MTELDAPSEFDVSRHASDHEIDNKYENSHLFGFRHKCSKCCRENLSNGAAWVLRNLPIGGIDLPMYLGRNRKYTNFCFEMIAIILLIVTLKFAMRELKSLGHVNNILEQQVSFEPNRKLANNFEKIQLIGEDSVRDIFIELHANKPLTIDFCK